MNQTTQKRTIPEGKLRGFHIAGASLAVLFGIAFLKGRTK